MDQETIKKLLQEFSRISGEPTNKIKEHMDFINMGIDIARMDNTQKPIVNTPVETNGYYKIICGNIKSTLKANEYYKLVDYYYEPSEIYISNYLIKINNIIKTCSVVYGSDLYRLDDYKVTGLIIVCKPMSKNDAENYIKYENMPNSAYNANNTIKVNQSQLQTELQDGKHYILRSFMYDSSTEGFTDRHLTGFYRALLGCFALPRSYAYSLTDNTFNTGKDIKMELDTDFYKHVGFELTLFAID